MLNRHNVKAVGEQVQGVQITLPVGSIIHNRYRVEALLGRGGFGAVYRVHDQRVKGNIFALKEVIDPSLEERERFAFECNILKRVDHSSLPRVYQEFEDESTHRIYMLMDFVDGPNLEHLRLQQPQKRFPLVRALELMAPIFEAVSYLHEQEPPIIHRDIKPANIIVPREGNATVLVDLGIAKEYDQESTTTAIRRCSPGYGAPEQYARGTNIRTDIYGLAATMYVLLTGEIPTDALYRMTQLGSKNLDPLEPLRTLAPDVPPQVADAIMRSLSINSDDRFATTDEFWQAIQVAPSDLAVLPITHPIPDAPASEPVEKPTSDKSSVTGVTTVVYPVSSVRDHIYPNPAKRSRRPLSWVLFFVLLALLALGTGVMFGTHFFAQAVSPTAHTSHPAITPTSASHASAAPTSAPKATATSLPTVAPTPVPTAKPTPVSASYPQLDSQYNGQLIDQYTSPATTTSMKLSNIQQRANSSSISGYFSVGPELIGNGNFTGTVTQDKHIQFAVSSYNGLLPLFFTGTILVNGNMHGTYCSARQSGNTYQCDKAWGGYGTWQVASPHSQSSLPSTGSSQIADLPSLSNYWNDDKWQQTRQLIPVDRQQSLIGLHGDKIFHVYCCHAGAC